jgi:ribosomal protein S18 acetylase RimI-like enzyme
MVTIRLFHGADRERVRQILAGLPNFTAEEVATALELADEYLSAGEASGYLPFVLAEERDDGETVWGYVCVGPTPLTDGTFDLYWVAVDSAAQGKGYGRALLAFAEDEARHRDGRLLLIETSSQASYGATVRFYERAGYALEARVRDFYRIGDDKIIFAKRLR